MRAVLRNAGGGFVACASLTRWRFALGKPAAVRACGNRKDGTMACQHCATSLMPAVRSM